MRLLVLILMLILMLMLVAITMLWLLVRILKQVSLQLNKLVRNLLQTMLASEGELQMLGIRGRQPDHLQPPSFVLSGSRSFGCEGVG